MVVKAIVAVKSTAKNVCIFHVISNSIFKNDINLISTTYSITSVTSIFDGLSSEAANLDGQQDGDANLVAQLVRDREQTQDETGTKACHFFR